MFPGEVSLLSVLQYPRQLGIAIVVGENQHLRTGPCIGIAVVRRRLLAPTGPGLHPEDHCRNVPALCGGEQTARDHRIGLGYAAVELSAKVFAQRLGGAADYSPPRSSGGDRARG